MPGATAGSIRTVLSGPGVRRTFASALLGRLTYGLLPLCLLFTVRDGSGSFALAATATAAHALATLAMPVQARLVDRHGQRRVLPLYAAAFVTVLVALLVLAGRPDLDVPPATWVGLALLLGLAAPALGPATRAQWREIAPEGPARRAAYSLDSVGEESLFLLGPLLAGAVLTTGHPEAGLLVAATCTTVGTVGLSRSRYVPTATRRSPTGDRVRRPGPLTVGRFRRPLVALVLTGAAGASCFIGVASLADRAHRPGVLGLLESVTGVGAILAGLCWARVRREPAWTTTLTVLLAVDLAAQTGAAALVPHLLGVGAVLVVTGTLTAPLLVVAFTAADSLVPAEARTEASTWVSTALNAGSALGTTLTAVLVATPRAPFVAAAGLSLAAVVVVLSTRRRSGVDASVPAP